jgi:phenylacetate-CoA ligase
MSLGGFVRRVSFWTNDFFHASPIRKHYNDIRTILKNKDNIGIITQKEHLQNILTHAVTKSKFYSKYDANNIETFPIINKFIIRDNYDYINVELSEIPEHKGNMHIQRTSGSTGTPLAVPQDKRKRNRRIAELKYFGKIAGYNSHEKLAQLRIWTKWHSKSKIQSFKENIYAIDCSRINDDILSNLCTLIKKKKIKAIWGYASWYDKFAEFVERKSIKLPSIKVLMAGSEMLQPSTRTKLKYLLKCNVISRYSNEEQGILGQDKKSIEHYYLNHASYYFEFLKLDSDEKGKLGEICRIVVTDLFNYAFPMIRYDTGDTGIYIIENNASEGFPVLSKIYGRLLDLVYDPKGTVIHPMTLARILKNYDEIKLWQFIQKDINRYELKLKLAANMNLSDCLKQVQEIFGEDSLIDISLVNDIPVLSSGKRKPVVNEWKK